MKKIILIAFIMLLPKVVSAECYPIEYAELKDMTKTELHEVINKIDAEYKAQNTQAQVATIRQIWKEAETAISHAEKCKYELERVIRIEGKKTKQ